MKSEKNSDRTGEKKYIVFVKRNEKSIRRVKEYFALVEEEEIMEVKGRYIHIEC